MDWCEEWWSSTLGNGGFWRREAPADHFRTSVGNVRDPAMADEMAWVLLELLDPIPGDGTPSPLHGLVDLGAADGSLLQAIAARRPDWALHGVDVRPAPARLPGGAVWSRAIWDVRSSSWTDLEGRRTDPPWAGALTGPVLVLAHEWLDDLPCRVARRNGSDWELLAPEGGTGRAPDEAERDWLDAWAGDAEVAEVGLTRDRAWTSIVAGLPAGSVVVAIDYGHLRATRPPQGSLLGYRHGRPVTPMPDGRTNITAPVAVDALVAAVERLPGVRRLLFARQTDVLADRAPDNDDAPDNDHRAGDDRAAGHREPPLQRLVRANRRRTLRDADRLGANWWLAHRIGATA